LLKSQKRIIKYFINNNDIQIKVKENQNFSRKCSGGGIILKFRANLPVNNVQQGRSRHGGN